MTPVRTQIRETFESLRSRNFRLFFLGQAVSVTGTWMQQVAAAWLVLRLTGSGVALGVDTGLTFLPLLLFGLRGGELADRADRRKILLVTNAALGVLALVLWAIVDTGLANEATRALWDQVLDGAAARGPVRRVLVTHFHPDHLGGVPELAEAIPIRTFIDYGSPLGSDRMTRGFATYEPVRSPIGHLVPRPGCRRTR